MSTLTTVPAQAWLRRAGRIGVLACGLCLPWGHTALAEESEARATRLFDEGKAALDAGRTVEACEKLGQSQQLAPRVGTLLNLARCREQQGRFVTALGHWQQAEELANQTDDSRATVARERAAALDARLPTLTIELAGSAPANLSVRCSNERTGEATPVPLGQLGVARRADPGPTRVVLQMAGRPARDYSIVLAEGARETLRVELPGAPSSGTATSEPAGGDVASGGMSGWTVGGIVLGCAGLVGLGVGAAFAGIASSKNAESTELGADGVPRCDEGNYCSDEGLELRDAAIGAATASTALFVVGGVLAAAGLAMVIFAPDDEEPTTEPETALRLELGVGPGTVMLRGDF